MTAETLLSRLDGARRVGEGRWIARCPAHGDRDPSLVVTELNDGRVLIHCHAGCGAADVMAAVGLGMADLFADKPLYHHGKSVLRKSETRAYHESVVEIAATDYSRGCRMSREDLDRVKASRDWLVSHPTHEDTR